MRKMNVGLVRLAMLAAFLWPVPLATAAAGADDRGSLGDLLAPSSWRPRRPAIVAVTSDPGGLRITRTAGEVSEKDQALVVLRIPGLLEPPKIDLWNTTLRVSFTIDANGNPGQVAIGRNFFDNTFAMFVAKPVVVPVPAEGVLIPEGVRLYYRLSAHSADGFWLYVSVSTGDYDDRGGQVIRRIGKYHGNRGLGMDLALEPTVIGLVGKHDFGWTILLHEMKIEDAGPKPQPPLEPVGAAPPADVSPAAGGGAASPQFRPPPAATAPAPGGKFVD